MPSQAALPSRPASPAPSSSAPAPSQSGLPEDPRTLLSLPAAVLRRAQQLPGSIPLPNGHQVELLGRALLQPGVDDRIVVVRDDEPTSLLAYALSSRQASWVPHSMAVIKTPLCLHVPRRLRLHSRARKSNAHMCI